MTMLPIDKMRVEMRVYSNEITDENVFAVIGNYELECGEFVKIDANRRDDDNDENNVMSYKVLLYNGRAVEMARILQKEVYPGTDCQYNQKLVDSMKELDRDAYYKAQIILAKEQISVSLWQAENNGKD